MKKVEFNKSVIFSLIDTIEYSDDSIVSKSILSKNLGTITLFAFDKGQALSKHQAPFDALIQIVDGKAEIVINNEKYVLGKDESIIMPANEVHEVKALEKFKMALSMIKSE